MKKTPKNITNLLEIRSYTQSKFHILCDVDLEPVIFSDEIDLFDNTEDGEDRRFNAVVVASTESLMEKVVTFLKNDGLVGKREILKTIELPYEEMLDWCANHDDDIDSLCFFSLNKKELEYGVQWLK